MQNADCTMSLFQGWCDVVVKELEVVALDVTESSLPRWLMRAALKDTTQLLVSVSESPGKHPAG